MVTIDLHDYYARYPTGSYLDVPDEIAEALEEERRRENAYLRRLFRHGAYFTLDGNDGIELSAISRPPMPDELYDGGITQ